MTTDDLGEPVQTGEATEESADRAKPDPTTGSPDVEAEKHAADLTSEETQADPQTRLSQENAGTSLDQPSDDSS